MSGTRHLSTRPGKRVVLLMRDGLRIEGRFKKRDERKEWLWLEDLPEPILCRKVRAIIVNPHANPHLSGEQEVAA